MFACVHDCVFFHECGGRERSWQRRWCDLTWLRLVKDARGLGGSQCGPARSIPPSFSFPPSPFYLCLSIPLPSQHSSVHLHPLSLYLLRHFAFRLSCGIFSELFRWGVFGCICVFFSLILRPSLLYLTLPLYCLPLSIAMITRCHLVWLLCGDEKVQAWPLYLSQSLHCE